MSRKTTEKSGQEQKKEQKEKERICAEAYGLFSICLGGFNLVAFCVL